MAAQVKNRINEQLKAPLEEMLVKIEDYHKYELKAYQLAWYMRENEAQIAYRRYQDLMVKETLYKAC